MLLLFFIIQVFHKSYDVLWIVGRLVRFVHDALVKLYKICPSLYKVAYSYTQVYELEKFFNTNCLCTIKKLNDHVEI